LFENTKLHLFLYTPNIKPTPNSRYVSTHRMYSIVEYKYAHTYVHACIDVYVTIFIAAVIRTIENGSIDRINHGTKRCRAHQLRSTTLVSNIK